MRTQLKHIDRFRDRHGKERLYYRAPGGKRIALPPRSDPVFLKAYLAAQGGQNSAIRPATNLPPKGSFQGLIRDYLSSTDFFQLADATKRKNRSHCDWLDKNYGLLPVESMRAKHVVAILKAKFDGSGPDRKVTGGPATRNTLLRVMRILMKRAIMHELRPNDPTIGIKLLKEGEHRAWTDSEVTKFEETFPVGTKERLAFELAVCTAQRRADVASMRWSHIDKDGHIQVQQKKTGTVLAIPIHQNLSACLERIERQCGEAILAKRDGGNYTAESFGNFFSDAIETAGLPPDCKLHGLRKLAAKRLAEVGCSVHQIQAMTGHKTLAEVERYTRDANQKQLAMQALAKMKGLGTATEDTGG
jgi:integrase